jgi:D-alanine-D-alanine ligase
MIWIAHTAVNPDSPASEAGVLDEVHAVREALEQLGYSYTVIAPEYDLPEFLAKISSFPDSLVFHLVESYHGDSMGESWLAGLYEALRIPYTGSPPIALSLCLDKRRARAILKLAGFPVTPGLSIDGRPLKVDGFTFPAIVKPACRDASEGLDASCVVWDLDSLERKVEELAAAGFMPLLLEKFIEGREFSLTLLENEDDWDAVAFFEVDFSGLDHHQPHMLCYDAKWAHETQAYEGTNTNPMSGDAEIKAKLCRLAVGAVKELGLRDYVRIDFRYSKTGKPYIIDVNPNPDISHSGGFYRALASAGIEFKEFVQQILNNAKRRGHEFKNQA